MPSIFSKNCVLSGCLDYYCLICEAQFRTEEETLDHISESQHKDKWKSCGYFEKYKQDFIKKIKGLYFCELCNVTFPTATKVGLHVDEQTHIAEKDKRNQFFKRVKNDIVVMDKYLIKEEAWNGFVDDTCVLCNTESDDITTHKASKSHILNLIKNNVIQFSNSAYRQIDARSTQCLICNKIFNENYSIHSESAAHISSIISVSSEHEETHKIGNNGKDTKPDNKTIQETVVDNGAKEEIGKTELKSSVASSKRNSIADVNDVLKTLGAKNYVIEQKGEQWCILCELIIGRPEEHIRSEHHQTLLKMHKERLENNIDRKNHAASSATKSASFEFAYFQKNSINIDLINETAACKKCQKNIDFNIDTIERHIKEHNNIVNKKSQQNAVPFPSGIKSNGTAKTTLYTKPVLLSAGKDTKPCSQTASSAAEVEVYAKQHGLSHNRADKSYYCKLCCRRLPTTLKDLENHVSSRGHKDKIAEHANMNTLQQNKKKVTVLTEFVELFEIVENITTMCVIVINNKYWLNIFDFFMIAKDLFNTIICLGCNIDLTPENVMQHIVSETHQKFMKKCVVITSLENEFVREIKADIYHCGYCNDVSRDWDDLLEHLQTSKHDRAKSEAQCRLRNHTPNPIFQQNVRELETMFNSFKNQFGFR